MIKKIKTKRRNKHELAKARSVIMTYIGNWHTLALAYTLALALAYTLALAYIGISLPLLNRGSYKTAAVREPNLVDGQSQ